jgi:hypothetical protein
VFVLLLPLVECGNEFTWYECEATGVPRHCDDSFVSASSEIANSVVSRLCLCRSPMLYQSIFYHMEVGMNVKLNAIT